MSLCLASLGVSCHSYVHILENKGKRTKHSNSASTNLLKQNVVLPPSVMWKNACLNVLTFLNIEGMFFNISVSVYGYDWPRLFLCAMKDILYLLKSPMTCKLYKG